MKPRPLAITVLGWLFVVACAAGLGYHLMPQHGATGDGFSDPHLPWVIAVRMLGIIAGAFLLLGRNWARWLLALWIAYHVCLSAVHSRFEFTVHGLLFVVAMFFLFRPKSSDFFAAPPPPAAPRPDVS